MATKQDSDTASSATAGAGPAAAPSSSASATKAEASSSSTPKDKSDAPATGAGALPIRDKESFNQMLISQYIARDHLHASAMLDDQENTNRHNRHSYKVIEDYKLVRNQYRPWFTPSRLYGEGYAGYGNGRTEIGGVSRLLYPQNKMRPGKRTTPPLKWKRKDMKQQAEQHEELVPVRLDVDWDKIRLRDTLTWNLHERLAPPELFAAQLVEDMGLKPPMAQPVYEQVVQQMHEQLNDFYPFVFSDEDALDPELPYSAWKNDEMRILVKLNITIGQHTLMDQFEWDINNPLNSPEEFAASMAKELSLSGEFTTAIAHCIREQTQLFTRSLYSVGHPFDGRPIEDPDLVAAFLPSPLPNVFRPQQQAKEYAPYLYELSEQELERHEVIFQREQRRQKRATVNRRGGPSLPDLKERQRTIRTLVVSSTLPGAATTQEESTLFKRVAGARKGRVRDELSDSDESEDSSPDSPATTQLAGTARTRGMRGAATAAVSRMANLGRSETPEATIHHHETRTSRRLGRELTREATEEPQQMLVVLKVGKERLKKFFRDQSQKVKQSTPSGSQTPSLPHARAPSASAQNAMPPPSTPNASNSGAAAAAARTPGSDIPAGQIGRQEAPAPTVTTPQPPLPSPPEWLVQSLEAWKQNESYANDQFEGIMRYSAVDATTGSPVAMPQPGNVPPNVRFYFLPRIRCLDCPGKLYTPGPDTSAKNFEVHLKNRAHREKVEARLRSNAT